jgi:hypothetical protein
MFDWFYDLVDVLKQFPPAVGVCIGVLAMVAVLMTARGEKMKTKETVLWVLVSFGLMLGEVYAIHHKDATDNRSAIEARIAEDDRFGAILHNTETEIDTTIAGFDATAKE